MLQELEGALALAPQVAWPAAACTYGQLITVLQAAEQALRQADLHCSGDQLQALRLAFLRQRRHDALEGCPPPPRPAQPERTPRRGQTQRRRRLPRLRS